MGKRFGLQPLRFFLSQVGKAVGILLGNFDQSAFNRIPKGVFAVLEKALQLPYPYGRKSALPDLSSS
jgi:hypothetical protein